MGNSVASLLLQSAAVDVAACKVLDAAPGMADTVIGFHAQQACEKCLKAVAGAAGIELPRSHDLVRLIELLAAQGIDIPPGAEWIDELNPYAVEARYGLVAKGGLDRGRVLLVIDAIFAWAQNRLDGAGPA